jgi:hypothetical protein
MIRSLRTRLTYANVMSTLLVFGALGGTSYAVTQLDRNSVRSKHIRNGQVKRADLARNSVNSSKVRDGRLLALDLAAGQVPRGAQGPPGERGVQGTEGGLGFVGDRVTVQFEQAATPLADNTKQTYTVFCPDGQKAIGGALRGDATDSEFTDVVSSRPAISSTDPSAPTDGGTFTGWSATVENPTGGAPPDGNILPEIWVICVQE